MVKTNGDAKLTLKTEEVMVNIGPQHPSTHGVFRLRVTFDGEQLHSAETVIGYLHRGAEKLCEREHYRQIVILFDRMHYIANCNSEPSVVMAAEKLMGLEAPERAQLILALIQI